MNLSEFWSAHYAARFEQLRAEEAQMRAEAFLSLPRTVAGERVRVMTPADLHLLDGIGNRLVSSGEPLLPDFLQLLWVVHTANSGRHTLADDFRRGLFLGRMHRRARRDLPALEHEVLAYLRFVFLDAPPASPGEGRPFGACFLAPVLVSLSAELGPADPMTGAPWSRTPLPALYQYLKALRRREEGKDFIDRSPSDRLMSECLEAFKQRKAG